MMSLPETLAPFSGLVCFRTLNIPPRREVRVTVFLMEESEERACGDAYAFGEVSNLRGQGLFFFFFTSNLQRKAIEFFFFF